MPKTFELLSLLNRCESPSRELDAKLAERLFRDQEYMSVVKDYRYDYALRYWPGGPEPEYTRVPSYTKSIDAALRAVPDGFEIILRIYKNSAKVELNSQSNLGLRHVVTAATAPLAICTVVAGLLGD